MAGGEGTEAEGIIRLAGGENAATGFQGYKQIADEAVLTAAPDLILMMAREGDLSIADASGLRSPHARGSPRTV
jgi:iron complex transport system substrate-binding protein